MEPVQPSLQPLSIVPSTETTSSPISGGHMYSLIKKKEEWGRKTTGRMEETLEKVRTFTLVFPSVLSQGQFVSDAFKGEWEHPQEIEKALETRKNELRQLRDVVTQHIYNKERFTTHTFPAPMNAVINLVGRLFKCLYDAIAVRGVAKKINEALQTLDSLGERYLYLLSRFNPEQYLNPFHFAMEVDAHPQLLHCTDELGNSLLHLASIHRNPRLIIALLEPKLFMFGDQRQAGKSALGSESHALLSLQNEEGNTALHMAVQNGDRQSVRLLCLYGAPTALPNKQGKTPMDLVSGEYAELIKQELEAATRTTNTQQ